MEIIGFIVVFVLGILFLLASIEFAAISTFDLDRRISIFMAVVYGVISEFLLYEAWVYAPFKLIAV